MNVVDFAPKISITGDLTKITDSERAKVNTVVNNFLKLLRMERGTLQEFPDQGLKEDLLTLFYNENPERVVTDIAAKASVFLGYKVEGVVVFDDTTVKTSAKITFTFDGLPGKFRADISESSGFAKIVNPQLIF